MKKGVSLITLSIYWLNLEKFKCSVSKMNTKLKEIIVISLEILSRSMKVKGQLLCDYKKVLLRDRKNRTARVVVSSHVPGEEGREAEGEGGDPSQGLQLWGGKMVSLDHVQRYLPFFPFPLPPFPVGHTN